MVKRERRPLDNTPAPVETVFFLSSFSPDAELRLSAIRTHWSIENNVHRTLDVVFREDDARLRVLNGAETLLFCVTSPLTLSSVIRPNSLKRKPFIAAHDDAFLAQFLDLS
jgi:predicted transposase YbfD/YdcC